MTDGANPLGFVDRVGRTAVILLVLIGLLGCFMSQRHIIPSLENEAMLLANCVPMTLKELTGYLWASADTPSLCTGMDLTRISHNNNCPL